MKHFMRLLPILVVIVLVFGATVIAQDDTIVIEPGSPVRFGVATALSGEGLVPLGTDILRGAELSLVDKPTVTVDGVEFEVELDAQDSQCNPEGGQAVANRFTSDETIVGVIGHMCSSSTVASAPIYSAAGYVMISPSSTGPSITQQGFSAFNRAVPNDDVQGVVAGQFIYDYLGVTKIATVHDGSPYGEGLVAVVSATIEELGGEVVAADAINVGDSDFRALLDEFAEAEPELIYFGGFAAEGSRLVQQREDAGLEDVLFMGADGIWGPEIVELAGSSSLGIYASKPVPANQEAYDAFLEAYETAYEESPPAPYHVNAYDAYSVLALAVEGVGEIDADGNLVISRQAFSDFVRSLEGFEGLTGTLTADGTGELITAAGASYGFYIVEEVDGELEFVEIDMMMEEDE